MSASASVQWQPRWLDALRGHLASGLSASMAAADLNTTFGTSFTRSAVIGKAHREDIPMAKRKAGPKKPRAPSTTRKPRTTPAQRPDIAIRRAQQSLPTIPSPFIARTVDVNTDNVTLLELSPYGCRWPLGDGPFTFCNHVQAGDGPYCAAHNRIAYRAPERR